MSWFDPHRCNLWFQDTDESAYYEFICKLAGVKVIYCAEVFENDGSPISSLWKNMKRLMAAEMSRDQSAKVFAGHCRIVGLGYRVGGRLGFALRRELVDATGKSRGFLELGQQKALQTDGVMLRAGFTGRLFDAINNILLDMLAAVARKDYEDRRRRQAQGQAKAKAEGKYKGRPEDAERNARIVRLLASSAGLVAVTPALLTTA
jgi:hypothetical protein